MYAEAQAVSTALNPQTEPLRLEDLIGKITCADCMDILRQLPDKCVDLVLTDPPYFGIVKNDWDNQWKNIFEFQKWVGEVGKEIKRVLKDNGSLYWFGDDKTIAYCQVELDKQLTLLNNITWRKPCLQTLKGVNVFRSYMPITERILFYDKGEDKTGLEMVKNVMPNPFAKYLKDELLPYFGSVANFRKFVVKEMHLDSAMVNRWFDSDCLMTKDKYLFIREKTGKLRREYEELRREYEELRREYEELRRVWNNDSKATDVLDFAICSDNGRFHPTQKPLNLICYLMERSSKENDLVLDCFSGSGTTAIACHRLNRRFICIEKDKEYWAASVKRLEDERRQLSLFGGNQ
jgi:site-specific DNA-methyltransferase (adenine-specific)